MCPRTRHGRRCSTTHRRVSVSWAWSSDMPNSIEMPCPKSSLHPDMHAAVNIHLETRSHFVCPFQSWVFCARFLIMVLVQQLIRLSKEDLLPKEVWDVFHEELVGISKRNTQSQSRCQKALLSATSFTSVKREQIHLPFEWLSAKRREEIFLVLWPQLPSSRSKWRHPASTQRRKGVCCCGKVRCSNVARVLSFFSWECRKIYHDPTSLEVYMGWLSREVWSIQV